MTFSNATVRAVAVMAAMASMAQGMPHAARATRTTDPCSIQICTMEYAPVCGMCDLVEQVASLMHVHLCSLDIAAVCSIRVADGLAK